MANIDDIYENFNFMSVDEAKRRNKERWARVLGILEGFRRDRLDKALANGDRNPEYWSQAAMEKETGLNLGYVPTAMIPELLINAVAYLKMEPSLVDIVFQIAQMKPPDFVAQPARLAEMRHLVNRLQVPALVVDRAWQVLHANSGAYRLFYGGYKDLPLGSEDIRANMLYLLFDKDLELVKRIKGTDMELSAYRYYHVARYFAENSRCYWDKQVNITIDALRSFPVFNTAWKSFEASFKNLGVWECRSMIQQPDDGFWVNVVTHYIGKMSIYNDMPIFSYPLVLWYEPADAWAKRFYRKHGLSFTPDISEYQRYVGVA